MLAVVVVAYAALCAAGQQPRPVSLPLGRTGGRLSAAAARVPDWVGSGWVAPAAMRKRKVHLPPRRPPNSTRLARPAWTARLWSAGASPRPPAHIEVTMLDVLVYTNISIGTGESAQETLRVQVDTGSSSLAVPAAECTNCRRRCPRCMYEGARSPSARVVRCESLVCQGARVTRRADCWTPSSGCAFILSYADGSEARGDIVEDTVRLGPLTAEGVAFARIWRESPPGGFTNLEVDGILGLAGRDLNMGGAMEETVAVELTKQSGLPPLFSVSVGFQGRPGSGVLTLGGIDESRVTDVQWTPLLPGGWYVVQLNCMTIGDLVVTDDPDDFGDLTIVDSGTTMTLLPYSVMQRLRTVLLSGWGHLPHVSAPHPYSIFDSGQCFSDIDPEQFPSITFTFAGGVAVTVTPDNYFSTAFQDGLVFYCFGITGGDFPSQWHVAPTQTILGDTFMNAADVVFDRESGRIGFSGPLVSKAAQRGACASASVSTSSRIRKTLRQLESLKTALPLLAIVGSVGYLLCALVQWSMPSATTRSPLTTPVYRRVPSFTHDEV
eukprot:TRINITY_DN11472_c0_g1_i1.p1 TRINITY_DN11472_c0_g1~~TRINITY_DN11472_c0_g1_i1.p1  ORF type:complete len:579 (+),score=137.77 TRINITY_DN11472_c0_g1_i1:85-1737(+)